MIAWPLGYGDGTNKRTKDDGLASEAYEHILHIQSLDLSLAQLRHRIEHHPARAAIAEVDEAIGEHDGRAAAVAERRHELQRTQKRYEDEVAVIEDKRKNVDGKLYGGDVTASKELLALQGEAVSLLGRQNQIEEADLEIMEQLEEVDGELATMSETRATYDERRAGLESELVAALAEIETEIASVSSQRDAAVGSANVQLLKTYESLRVEFGGQPVARLVGSSCDGCHIQLSAVAVDRIGKMAQDAVVTCEECGRLLVR